MDAAALRFDLGGDVYIRPVEGTDVSSVLDVVRSNYGHLRTFMEWAKPDYGLADARAWVDASLTGQRELSELNFVIFRGESMIGAIGLASFDHNAKVTEIGYWIDKNEQGKGITRRACERLITLAFGTLGMNRVQIRCAAVNERSAAIPLKLGFTKEGVQRQHVMRDGKIYDFLIFGLLRSEWKGR